MARWTSTSLRSRAVAGGSPRIALQRVNPTRVASGTRYRAAASNAGSMGVGGRSATGWVAGWERPSTPRSGLRWKRRSGWTQPGARGRSRGARGRRRRSRRRRCAGTAGSHGHREGQDVTRRTERDRRLIMVTMLAAQSETVTSDPRDGKPGIAVRREAGHCCATGSRALLCDGKPGLAAAAAGRVWSA